VTSGVSANPPAAFRPRYRFGEFVVSPGRRLLLRGGIEVPVIPRYFDVLVLLIERRHEAVHRIEIIDRVWTDVVVSDGALSQAVRTLRRALGEDPRAPRFIRTVARYGYQFVFADVVEEDDGAGPGGGPTVPGSPGIPGSRARRQTHRNPAPPPGTPSNRFWKFSSRRAEPEAPPTRSDATPPPSCTHSERPKLCGTSTGEPATRWPAPFCVRPVGTWPRGRGSASWF